MVFTRKDGDFHGRTVSFREGTWRIIPGRNVSGSLAHGDRFRYKSPKDRVVGPLPSMAFLWFINGGYLPWHILGDRLIPEQLL